MREDPRQEHAQWAVLDTRDGYISYPLDVYNGMVGIASHPASAYSTAGITRIPEENASSIL